MNIKTLEEELLKLPAKQRAELTLKMLESLENDETVDTDKIWLEESLRRYHSIESNKSELIDSESVIREAKSKYQ